MPNSIKKVERRKKKRQLDVSEGSDEDNDDDDADGGDKTGAGGRGKDERTANLVVFPLHLNVPSRIVVRCLTRKEI